MKNNQNHELCQLFEWINSLNDDFQLDILAFITNKSNELNLCDEDNTKFDDMVDKITSLIAENDRTPESIQILMKDCGLNKLFVTPLYEYCNELSRPIIDAKVVASIDKDDLATVCSFVLNKMILYKDYISISLDTVASQTKTNDTDKIRRTLAFIYNSYIRVCSRQLSPDGLFNSLIEKYNFSEELCSLIITPLNKDLANAQQAYLLEKIEDLSNAITPPVASDEILD